MKITRWCLPVQKTRFQLSILNIPFEKSHIGDLRVNLRPSPPM